ncbi:MFS transporter [Rhodococcus sp. WS1]|uniref:MFS transporter n=1 Tax=unclassified Rhodococcus (in: high G+C Gram-positive bacteria) TaxID=192944 RepID=UPI001143BBB4|nr:MULTISPECIES: MFS transporter [unclassified Rhodococcus (in: high G+C Gram-positive bacteria)]ROZ52878.1 MFS transporter [Rhodococcus sp. WS1]TQC35970.1 MFS transporter [Rhodococcus sp. WS7]
MSLQSHTSSAHTDVPQTPPSAQAVRDARKAVVAASVGNGLEWFDLTVYGTFAVTISALFFPTDNPTASLMLAFLSFGISFIMRPIGAVVIGRYSDRKGRKAGLMLSIVLMFAGTLIIVMAPTAATIGVAASVIIVLARLLQGFSAGGEFASATTFLVEYAPNRKSFYGSWQVATQGAAILLAGLFGFVLNNYLSEHSLESWGWRIPFIFALLIGPVGMYIRNTMEETPEFRSTTPSKAPVIDTFTTNRGRMLTIVGIVALCTVSAYMALYMPTYAIRSLGMAPAGAFVSTLTFGAVLFVAAPLFGIVADRIGATRVMLPAAVASAVVAIPLFAFIAAVPHLAVMVGIEIVFGVLAAAYFGPVPALMSAVFPAASRTTGLSIAYNIGVTVFGGFAPFILTWLIDVTGTVLAPSFYLLAIAIVSVCSTVVIRRRYAQR